MQIYQSLTVGLTAQQHAFDVAIERRLGQTVSVHTGDNQVNISIVVRIAPRQSSIAHALQRRLTASVDLQSILLQRARNKIVLVKVETFAIGYIPSGNGQIQITVSVVVTPSQGAVIDANELLTRADVFK